MFKDSHFHFVRFLGLSPQRLAIEPCCATRHISKMAAQVSVKVHLSLSLICPLFSYRFSFVSKKTQSSLLMSKLINWTVPLIKSSGFFIDFDTSSRGNVIREFFDEDVFISCHVSMKCWPQSFGVQRSHNWNFAAFKL